MLIRLDGQHVQSGWRVVSDQDNEANLLSCHSSSCICDVTDHSLLFTHTAQTMSWTVARSRMRLHTHPLPPHRIPFYVSLLQLFARYSQGQFIFTVKECRAYAMCCWQLYHQLMNMLGLSPRMSQIGDKLISEALASRGANTQPWISHVIFTFY